MVSGAMSEVVLGRDGKPVSLQPMSTEEWAKLSEREQQLSFIADHIAYWIRFTTGEMKAEQLAVTPDTYVMLPGDNAPPHWPSLGQLAKWLEVLRATPESAPPAKQTAA